MQMIVCSLAAWMICLCVEQPLRAQDPAEPIGVDAVAAPVESGTVSEEPVEIRPPVELIPLAIFESDLKALSELLRETTSAVGHVEWQREGPLFSILEDVAVEKIVANSPGGQARIRYEMFMTVPIGGGDDYSMAVAAAFPKAAFTGDDSIGIDLEGIHPDAQGFASIPDDEILLLMDEDVVCLFACEQGPYADQRNLLLKLRDQFLRAPPTQPFRVSISPQQIRPSLREPFVNQILAVVRTAIQQRDREGELEFRLREAWSKPVTELIDLAANQVETFAIELTRRETQPGVTFAVSARAVADSQFDAWLSGQQQVRSRAARLIHPEADGFLSVALALPNVLRETLPPLASALAVRLNTEGLVSPAAAAEIETAIRGIVAQGVFEIVVQSFTDSAGNQSLAICFPLTDSPGFSNASLELVSLIELDGLEIARTDIDGWPVHVYRTGTIPFLAGSSDALQLVVSDQLVIAVMGRSDSTELVTDLLRHDFSDIEDLARQRRLGFSIRGEFLKTFAALASDSSLRSYYFGEHDDTVIATEDSFSAFLSTDNHELRISATFDRMTSVVGLNTFEMLIFLPLTALEGF